MDRPENIGPPDRAHELVSDVPEHGGERRRFLVWALMIGATTPERVVERVLAEVEREASQ